MIGVAQVINKKSGEERFTAKDEEVRYNLINKPQLDYCTISYIVYTVRTSNHLDQLLTANC